LVLLANLVGPMIRDHWAIENGLHWIMDSAPQAHTRRRFEMN
jgi:predicted transposase YbfD/YdcC